MVSNIRRSHFYHQCGISWRFWSPQKYQRAIFRLCISTGQDTRFQQQALSLETFRRLFRYINFTFNLLWKPRIVNRPTLAKVQENRNGYQNNNNEKWSGSTKTNCVVRFRHEAHLYQCIYSWTLSIGHRYGRVALMLLFIPPGNKTPDSMDRRSTLSIQCCLLCTDFFIYEAAPSYSCIKLCRTCPARQNSILAMTAARFWWTQAHGKLVSMRRSMGHLM